MLSHDELGTTNVLHVPAAVREQLLMDYQNLALDDYGLPLDRRPTSVRKSQSIHRLAVKCLDVVGWKSCSWSEACDMLLIQLVLFNQFNSALLGGVVVNGDFVVYAKYASRGRKPVTKWVCSVEGHQDKWFCKSGKCSYREKCDDSEKLC